jgi:ATP-dependent Lhr-like helicase
MLVEDAHGQPPNIPFWRGEAPARTAELSEFVGSLRERVSEMMGDMSPTEFTSIVAGHLNHPRTAAAVEWLKQECGLDESGALQLISHILNGRAVLGSVPTQKTVIAERFFDEAGGMQLVIHAPFGARVNKAWGLSLRKRFCKSFNFELQAAATDNGLNISLAEQHSFPLADVFNFLQPETVGEVLQQAVLTGSPIFQTRWRWDANRALALLRFQGGKKVPPQIQRMRSDDLLASVFPDVAACNENIEGDIQVPDHPLVKEVMKDVMHEAMDLEGLKRVLTGIRDGSIRTISVDTPLPSQFSHEILNANPYAYLDDAPLEERRARAVSLRQSLPQSVLEEVGGLDMAAIEQVREEAWPDVRDEDELADALFTMVALPEQTVMPVPDGGRMAIAERWAPMFERLRANGRATVARVGDERSWVASEKARTFRAAYPLAVFESEVAEIEKEDPAHSDAVLSVVQGWMQHAGPVTAAQLSSVLHLHAEEVLQALLRLEASGTVLRGWYSMTRPADGNSSLDDGRLAHSMEWCERRLLARVHRLTLGRLRKEIEPVTPAQFMRWLLRWQHVEPGSQAGGDHGLNEVIQQLQGFEIPANAWERHVLSQRVRGYDPETLDDLCLTGAVGWGRLSPHPATVTEVEAGRPARRVVPTSVAPITLFLREHSDWMAMNPHLGVGAMRHASEDIFLGLSAGARTVFDFLRERGASFLADVVRGTAKTKSEAESGLWELVAAGLVTADGFDNLRSLIDPSRRTGKRSRTAGRWTLLYPVEMADRAKAIEATCWMLLRRYGVVFRELLSRETMVPKWRELCIGFRRLEDRGEIRGGRFVTGFIGEQFALPVAVESVRAMRKLPPSNEVITISAADPLNLVGIVVPGERVPAISGRWVRFRDGVFVNGEDAVIPMAATGG